MFNLSKEKQTILEYHKRCRQLMERAFYELKLNHQYNLKDDDDVCLIIDPRQFVAWLVDIRHELSHSSWRQYKSAVICFLSEFNDDRYYDAIDYLKQFNGSDCIKKSSATSSTKLKKLPHKDYEKLEKYFIKHPSKWQKPLLDWLKAATITGLRPQEWIGCHIEMIDLDKPALVVKNAKHTNGRAHGETRKILLDKVTNEELIIIETHIKRINNWYNMGQYKTFYNGCSFTLHYVSRKIWPRRTKHFTLYSARHQFSADAKSSGLTREEIAAMMGHAVDRTAILHYGRKSSGQDLIKVSAYSEDVIKVKSSYKTKEEFYLARSKEPEPKQIT